MWESDAVWAHARRRGQAHARRRGQVRAEPVWGTVAGAGDGYMTLRLLWWDAGAPPPLQ